MFSINFYNKEIIESILPGYWHVEPGADWKTNSIAINDGQLKQAEGQPLFIAIDPDTWHKGSGNTGIYKGWKDTHLIVNKFSQYMNGVIAQRPIERLDNKIPQYITNNTYDAIKLLAGYSYDTFNGKTIAITGTAGKSTTKNLLNALLSEKGEVVATRGNHNTRTGVPLTIACAVTQPDYLVLETAISALWMRKGGVMKSYPADIAMITSIDGGQQKTAHETALQKAKIAEGMNHQGTVILNRDMNEYDTVYSTVKKYNSNIITYGFHKDADVRVVEMTELKTSMRMTADILGESVTFDTFLNGKGMAQNIIGALTAVKLLGIDLKDILEALNHYQPKEGVQTFESHQLSPSESFTILDDSWNATGVSMLEAVDLFGRKSEYYSGRKIAVLGRIVNLEEKEAKRQHQAIAQPLIDSGVDIVFTYGDEMKHMLRKLPEHLIGGHFENADQLAKSLSNIISHDDFILIKGSRRGNQFAVIKRKILNYLTQPVRQSLPSPGHPYADGYGAATYDFETGEKVGHAGDQKVTQNQGLGGVLLTHYVLEKLFSKSFELTDEFLPGRQALKEINAPKALQFTEGTPVSLRDLLSAALLNQSPNALIMLANQVVGSNKKSIEAVKEIASDNDINQKAVLNLTGRRISNKTQSISLESLSKAGRLLFDKAPFILDLMTMKSFSYNQRTYNHFSNLYAYGYITHGLFFGHKDSLAVVLSRIGGKKYVTVCAGCTDAFQRDSLIIESIESVCLKDMSPVTEHIFEMSQKESVINIIGDTYAGEFYTNIRKKRDRKDALQTEGRSYSFDALRPKFSKGDFNIVNFEAAVSKDTNARLKSRKPFVLHSDPGETGDYLKNENIHLATLANNHLLDCGVQGLQNTLKELNEYGIETIGAGMNQIDAEKPFTIQQNGRRVTFLNAYWYRNPMYKEFDFYAVGAEAGVASLSGRILKNIKNEKEKYPNGKVIVIAHWGVDFQTVHPKQKEYARELVGAGADLIIGHGAHMIQEVETIHNVPVVYSIGNGVFNSDGEYNRRFVAPYSMMGQIRTDGYFMELRLYPFYCNNKKTYWQPRFVSDKEFEHCSLVLSAFGSTKLKHGYDDAHYYSLKI